MVKNNLKLSVIVIAGNEQDMISDCLKSACLKSALFASEIILITTPINSDNTLKVAQKVTPTLISSHYSPPGIDFSAWRNHGAKLAKGQWILFLDADERISSELKSEIQKIINQPNPKFTNYDLPN